MDHLLYGAAYYDEYMPCERLEEDIRLNRGEHLEHLRAAGWRL